MYSVKGHILLTWQSRQGKGWQHSAEADGEGLFGLDVKISNITSFKANLFLFYLHRLLFLRTHATLKCPALVKVESPSVLSLPETSSPKTTAYLQCNMINLANHCEQFYNLMLTIKENILCVWIKIKLLHFCLTLFTALRMLLYVTSYNYMIN